MGLTARLLLIGSAGALGTLARYGISVWAARSFGTAFPFGTLFVNLIGCFLITGITHVALTTTLVPQTLRLTLTVGFLGGLTTYSSFDLETTNLVRQRDWAMAAWNLGLTVMGCFAAGLLGLALARWLVGE